MSKGTFIQLLQTENVASLETVTKTGQMMVLEIIQVVSHLHTI